MTRVPCDLCGIRLVAPGELCPRCCSAVWHEIALRTLVGGEAGRRLARVLRDTDGEDERRATVE